MSSTTQRNTRNAYPPTLPTLPIVDRQLGVTARQLGGSKSHDVGGALRAFLRKRHPEDTAKAVGRLVGISPHSVDKWLNRASIPSGVALLQLIIAYGPELAVALMPDGPEWLKEAWRSEARKKLTAEMAEMAAKLEQIR